jgi:hypothetical protein
LSREYAILSDVEISTLSRLIDKCANPRRIGFEGEKELRKILMRSAGDACGPALGGMRSCRPEADVPVMMNRLSHPAAHLQCGTYCAREPNDAV